MTKILLQTLLLSSILFAQNFDGGFNFLIPSADSAYSAFMPMFPKTKIGNDFVGISPDGFFAVNGERIRFWGANLVGSGAFPQKSKTGQIAGHLQKLGFNLIRLHHMDNGWGGASLFTFGQSTRNINPTYLDRMHNLIAALKNHGIYTNMNLHVSRDFQVSDGIPDADSIADFGKGVTLFDPYLIMLQKEFAKNLLTTVNPYTGLSPVNDPAIAMVEITNENSLYIMWKNGNLRHIKEGGTLTWRHKRMLDTLYHSYLKSKYNSDAELQQAWGGASQIGTNNLIKNGGFEQSPITTNWFLEKYSGAEGSVVADVNSPQAGVLSAKVSVTKTTGTDWHFQFNQGGLTLYKDTAYVLTFYAKSSLNNAKLNVAFQQIASPYEVYAYSNYTLSTTWKKYSLSFSPTKTIVGLTKLSYQFANQVADFWFDEVSLTTTKGSGVLPGESLTAGNIKRLEFSEHAEFSQKRVSDQSEFYVKIQDDYYREMHSFLKDSVGVKVPMNSTNWNMGFYDFMVQSTTDYMDNHAYWDHPTFPGVPWSGTDWLINNNPMVKSSWGGTIPNLFNGGKIKGMPYTISEYNHSFPNRYQSESMLMITAYSLFHNVDAIMWFDYNGGTEFDEDKIPGYFSIRSNTAMIGQSPAMAFAFRNGLVAPSPNPLHLQFKRQDIIDWQKKEPPGWDSQNLYDKKIALTRGVVVDSYNAESTTDLSALPTFSNTIFAADNSQLIWNTAGVFTVNTPSFIGATGFMNQFPNTNLGQMKIKSFSDFGAIHWVSLTKDSLSRSYRSFITLVGKSQNTGMVWSGTTSVNDNWGSKPTITNSLRATLELTIQADSVMLSRLTSRGLPSFASWIRPTAPNTFTLELNQDTDKTIWYSITAYGAGVVSIGENKEIPKEFKVEEAYPNPFNHESVIRYSVPSSAEMSVNLYSSMGEQVAELFQGNVDAGVHELRWNGTSSSGEVVSSGVYILRLKYLDTVISKKLVVLK